MAHESVASVDATVRGMTCQKKSRTMGRKKRAYRSEPVVKALASDAR